MKNEAKNSSEMSTTWNHCLKDHIHCQKKYNYYAIPVLAYKVMKQGAKFIIN